MRIFGYQNRKVFTVFGYSILVLAIKFTRSIPYIWGLVVSTSLCSFEVMCVGIKILQSVFQLGCESDHSNKIGVPLNYKGTRMGEQ